LGCAVAELTMDNLLNTLHTKLVFGRRVRTLAKALSEMIPTGSRILDIGCGDGQVSARIMKGREEVSITGIDVLLRPERHIPVTQFDGTTIPFDNASFDVVMFVDVLHHTKDPTALLMEATRVTKKYILLKDHFRTGFLGALTLRFMDWIGNVHHGVVLPYTYLSETEWSQTYKDVGLRLISLTKALKLYPKPANLVFGRGLHFIALLEKI
jgi:ubiquinone/menaquinone biosynthesis C-methylase UbiE